MSVSVLTEANFDGMLLTTLLAEEQQRDGIEVGVVSGLSPSYSVARTILAVERMPVAVVIDADSPEPEVASERKRRAEEMLDDVAGGVPFRVIVAVPELEILFFERPDLLHRVFGHIDQHVFELARLSPRRAIGKLAPEQPYEFARFRILRAMDVDDVRVLRESDLVRDLLRFIEMAARYSKRPAVSKV
jgi:hypothetical protein